MPDLFPIPPAPGQTPMVLARIDGGIHQISVTFNVSAQRYYFNIYDQFGVWVCTRALIETGPGQMIIGISYEKPLRSMLVTLGEPWFRPLGQIVDLWLEGVDPEWLNGPHRSEVVSQTEFLFPVLGNPSLTIDPGLIALHGTASRFFNLVDGYKTNVLIWRNRKFEVF